MLSLKETLRNPFSSLSRSSTELTDLPNEILDWILKYIYHTSGHHLPSIFPLSRTCWRLRESAYPLILERLTIKASDDVIEKRSWLFLDHLLAHEHLLKYFRTLEIKSAVEARISPDGMEGQSSKIGQSVSKRKFFQCLDSMTGLRNLKLHYISDMNFDILEALKDTNPLRVSLDMNQSEKCFESRQSERLREILTSSPGWTCGLALPPSRYTQHPNGLADLVVAGKISAINWCDNWLLLETLVGRNHSFSNLEELHVSSKILEAQYCLLSPGVIPWPTLKRLHVEGDREIKSLFTSVIEKLTGLEDLKLHASTSIAFHPNCHDSTANTSTTQTLSNLPYTQLPSLRHLSLRGICPHLHVRHLTNPTLESLTLLLPEYHARLRGFTESRPASEIKYLANNLPNLTHLELHIGNLENLWNPTAIPGVEVNVEVYATLHAITQIRHLQTLRLFPPYVPRNAGHDYLNARQPLSDDQAIRVFHHLHSQRPSLHTLSIAATFYTLRGFSPMSWLVRDRGSSKKLLTTRQAGKDYELEQAWVGQRRNTMTNRRHGFRKPYLHDLGGGWVFPVEDPAV